MRIRINKQLAMLCKILDTTPQEVLQNFADNLSLDYRYTNRSDERSMAVEYFMRCDYGTHLFNGEQVKQMFDELNAIRFRFYQYGNGKEKEYLQDRDRRYKEFFKRWQEVKAKKK